jgi:hypothetical protein
MAFQDPESASCGGRTMAFQDRESASCGGWTIAFQDPESASCGGWIMAFQDPEKTPARTTDTMGLIRFGGHQMRGGYGVSHGPGDEAEAGA